MLRSYPDLDGADGPDYVALVLGVRPRGARHPRPLHAAAARAAHAPVRAAARAPLRGPAPAQPSGVPEASPSLREPARRAAPRHDGDGLAVRLTGYLGHTLGLGAAARGYVQALGRPASR